MEEEGSNLNLQDSVGNVKMESGIKVIRECNEDGGGEGERSVGGLLELNLKG